MAVQKALSRLYHTLYASCRFAVHLSASPPIFNFLSFPDRKTNLKISDANFYILLTKLKMPLSKVVNAAKITPADSFTHLVKSYLRLYLIFWYKLHIRNYQKYLTSIAHMTISLDRKFVAEIPRTRWFTSQNGMLIPNELWTFRLSILYIIRNVKSGTAFEVLLFFSASDKFSFEAGGICIFWTFSLSSLRNRGCKTFRFSID